MSEKNRARKISFLMLSILTGVIFLGACNFGETPHDCLIDGHIGGVATCKQKAICTVCNEKYGNYGEHRYGEYIPNQDFTCLKNETQTAACSVCGIKDTKELADSKRHHYVNGACVGCELEQVEYLLIDQNGVKYHLDDYVVLKKEQGNYPHKTDNGILYVSALKSGEIDVQTQGGYTTAMEFQGWFFDEQCENLLGKANVEIALNDESRIVLYAKVFKSEYFRLT